jgi:hypothetical protein
MKTTTLLEHELHQRPGTAHVEPTVLRRPQRGAVQPRPRGRLT